MSSEVDNLSARRLAGRLTILFCVMALPFILLMGYVFGGVGMLAAWPILMAAAYGLRVLWKRVPRQSED